MSDQKEKYKLMSIDKFASIKIKPEDAEKAALASLAIAEPLEDKLNGGLSDGMSLNDIAKKHNVDFDQLLAQFKKGTEMESEHTSDKDTAREIVKDHLFEDPEYYDKLDFIEK